MAIYIRSRSIAIKLVKVFQHVVMISKLISKIEKKKIHLFDPKIFQCTLQSVKNIDVIFLSPETALIFPFLTTLGMAVTNSMYTLDEFIERVKGNEDQETFVFVISELRIKMLSLHLLHFVHMLP